MWRSPVTAYHVVQVAVLKRVRGYRAGYGMGPMGARAQQEHNRSAPNTHAAIKRKKLLEHF